MKTPPTIEDMQKALQNGFEVDQRKRAMSSADATEATPEIAKDVANIPPSRLDVESLLTLSEKQELETRESYEASLDGAIEALKDTKGIVELKNQNVPTIVISDLHARRDFLMEVLSQQNQDGQSVFDLLEKGKINVVCLGDGMHSELGYRWNAIEDDLEKKDEAGFQTKMEEEMTASLGTMKLVMELKTAFPESFHFIRGNHDDINESVYGFKKYIPDKFGGESRLIKNWVTERFGENFLNKWAKFEGMLPLVVKGKDFVASHAAPVKKEVLSRGDIEERNKKANEQLLWADNTGIIGKEHFYPEFDQTRKNIGAENLTWIIGHRPVHNKFRTQFDGELIQINSPQKKLIAIFSPNEVFDPERNVFDLTKENIEGLGGGQDKDKRIVAQKIETADFSSEQQRLIELEKILDEHFPVEKMEFIAKFEVFSKNLLEKIENDCGEFLGKNIPDGEKKSFALTILKTEIAKKYSEYAGSIGLPSDLSAEIAEYITLRIKEI